MIKKIIITLTLFVMLLSAALPSLLGFSIFHLDHAVRVSTSMSAKLACSAKYITGLNEQQIIEDLSSYTPVLSIMDLNYDNGTKQVTASLLGMATISAQYRAATGCSLLMENSSNLDRIITRHIKPSPQAWPLGDSVDGIEVTLQQSLDNVLKTDNENAFNTRALIMVKDGQIVAESYSQGITPTTQLLGWSMAKSLTAIMLGRMQKMGMVDISQANLFTQWQGDDRKNITLKHLLQMSSGLAFDEAYAPGSDATHMLFTAKNASDVALKSSLEDIPSKTFSYSSGTTNLLTRFMHQQLGNSTQASVDFLVNEVFVPLGMQHSVFETDSSGIFVGSSYMYASGRDWARLGLLMLNKGSVNGKQLLDPTWVAQAIQPNQSNNDKKYGYQFWLNAGEDTLRWPKLPADAYAMAGNRRQSVMIIPSQNIIFIRLGWSKQHYPMESNYRQLLNQINVGNNS